MSRRVLVLGTASSIALCATLSQPAFAQDADDEAATEEPADDAENIITVTGFRASLESAQNIKRDADTFVDAITAEDIGALPDRSVAESLQRVPGVNIGRFEKTSDPDRFSVEGTGVIVRGLPYVRSELNGRDIFSATGGRELSFNDVSPELLGRVEVFKNVTADMIDGGIAGTVNLVTRKPLDTRGFKLAGTVAVNTGDLAKEWSPEISLLASNVWETGIGSIGVQLGYARSELVTRTDASQLTDPCYRDASLTGTCIRTTSANSDGVGAPTGFDASNFPPAGTVIAPKGAGVRTTRLERDREAINATLQFESNDGRFMLTAEYLRADTQFKTDEYAILALVNDDALFPSPRPGETWQFDGNGVFQSGILTQNVGNAYATPNGWGGIPMESLRFQRASDAYTEDFSLDLDFIASDRLRFNFEAQHISSDLQRDSVIGVMSTWADVAIDATGKTPLVQFLAPEGAPADYFSSGFYTTYWFLLDSVERNEGSLDSLRLDGEWDVSDDGFIKKARFGVRWADRDRTTRDTRFSTWGNLSAVWAGRAGCAPWGGGPGCFDSGPGPFGNGFIPGRLYTGLPGQEFAIAGGAFTDEFPGYSKLRNPFGDGFQRGNAPTPIENGAAWFFGGDDFLGEYLNGTTLAQAQEINTFAQTPNPFFGVSGRSYTDPVTGTVSQCDPFCPPEISSVGEETKAAYLRVDFGKEFPGGATLDGNIGLRYVHTTVKRDGLLGFPQTFFFDTLNGNDDGVVQVSEIQAACIAAPPGQPLPGYCSLSAARQAELAAGFTNAALRTNSNVGYDHWLPSFNAKLDLGNGLLFRVAVSKGISRPDLQQFSQSGLIGDNTGTLLSQGTLDTGTLFAISTGSTSLRPVESWNYDLSAEWYFADVGSLTAAVFMKDISGIVANGLETVNFTADGGEMLDVDVTSPSNKLSGTLKGFELTYQQTYDFLPGLLSGFGTQFTYTYVDGGDFVNVDLANNTGLFASSQPLAGISKHTINATLFYEKGPFAARAAYNWRSDFLITPRDDIFPFSPIWQEGSGQLDASIFYAVTDQIKLGVQGVNLLDSVTQTTQVVDFEGTRITRSAFRNDRRFTFLARFDF